MPPSRTLLKFQQLDREGITGEGCCTDGQAPSDWPIEQHTSHGFLVPAKSGVGVVQELCKEGGLIVSLLAGY